MLEIIDRKNFSMPQLMLASFTRVIITITFDGMKQFKLNIES